MGNTGSPKNVIGPCEFPRTSSAIPPASTTPGVEAYVDEIVRSRDKASDITF